MAGSTRTKGDNLAAKIIIKIDRILRWCYRLEDKTEVRTERKRTRENSASRNVFKTKGKYVFQNYQEHDKYVDRNFKKKKKKINMIFNGRLSVRYLSLCLLVSIRRVSAFLLTPSPKEQQNKNGGRL